jgi:superfamily II DNA or RNA helicase
MIILLIFLNKKIDSYLFNINMYKHIHININNKNKMDLRENQKECIDKIKKHFEKENKALIKMFCGSGKSFIIYHCLLEYSEKLSVVVVPSINLITQFNQDYLLNDTKKKYNNKYFDKQFKLITICSKNELDKKNNKSLIFTTDDKEITKFLKLKENKIVLVTYQSLKTLINIITKNKLKIDLICFDEAHHILADGTRKLLFGKSYDDYNYDSDGTDSDGSDDSDKSDDSDDSNSSEKDDENFIDRYVNKTLFFTATPKNSNEIKMYEPIVNITIEDEEYDIIDDENTYISDEINCGPMIYEYMHINGVTDNILNDFNIRVDLYTENKDNSIFEAISRTILETGNNRVLTFHSRSETKSDKSSDVSSFANIDNIKQFKKCFEKIIKNEFPKLKDKYTNIIFKGITAFTKDKIKILKEFDETSDNDIFILASCKTIGEGIDTKNANMVCFVDPKQSYVEIIQNIGRVCRKNETTKKLATILIPAYVDITKYKDCKGNPEKIDKIIREEMSKTGNFNGILNVLSALRQEDPYIFELCLKYPDTYTNKELGDNFKKNGLKLSEKEYDKEELFKKFDMKYINKKTEKENFERLGEKIDKNIIITNNKILEEDIIIDNEKDENIYLIETENDTYMKIKGETNSKKKIYRPNRNIKPFCHVNDEIKVLWNIESDVNMNKNIFGGYIKSVTVIQNEENWIVKFELIKKYIDENNKRPSSSDKNRQIKQYGQWISDQQKHYKKKIGIIKNKLIYNKWYDFINSEKYSKYFLSNEEEWNNNLELVKKYIDKYDKLPSTHDKKSIIKQLSIWVNTQQFAYQRNIYIMKNKLIYDEWTQFIDRYKKYFISNEEEWIGKLKLVKNYIDKYDARPIVRDKNQKFKQLGQWLSDQQQNYRKKEHIMKNNSIYDIYTKFINEIKYKKYFISNEEDWNNKFIKLKEYIDINDNLPSPHDKNSQIKIFGSWISNQQTKYQNNDQIMKNKLIYNKWTDFINNSKYSKYFLSNEEEWNNNLLQLQKYIDINNKRPSSTDKNNQIKILGNWTNHQTKKYTKKMGIMENKLIYNKWTDFINNKYKKYFISNEEEWNNNLIKVTKYIDENNKRPSVRSKKSPIKQLGAWINTQQNKYKKKIEIMKNESIYNKWTKFINNQKYEEFFKLKKDIPIKIIEDKPTKKPKIEPIKKTIDKPKIESIKDSIVIIKDESSNKKPTKKTIDIKLKIDTQSKETDEEYKQRKLSKYQILSKKISTQKSTNTSKMFKDESKLWEKYHKLRDFSFQGYEQSDIPVNQIIKYLETKTKHKLNILDLGCGRNYIKTHFKDIKNFTITGYDHVSYNGSIVADISNLDDELENTIDICIFSQSLMGSNWKKYMDESKKVLRYNGEMIISESGERYKIIKEYLTVIDMKIIKNEYDDKKRWFYINAIKQ